VQNDAEVERGKGLNASTLEKERRVSTLCRSRGRVGRQRHLCRAAATKWMRCGGRAVFSRRKKRLLSSLLKREPRSPLSVASSAVEHPAIDLVEP
jgi:hypothetical protein